MSGKEGEKRKGEEKGDKEKERERERERGHEKGDIAISPGEKGGGRERGHSYFS
jgi:hypothetical protein